MDKKKNRLWRYAALCGALVFVFTLAFAWKQYGTESVKAAAGEIVIGGKAGTEEYKLRSQQVIVSIEDLPAGTQVTWSIDNINIVRFKDQPTKDSVTVAGNITLQPVGIGTIVLAATYTDTTTNTDKTVYRSVNIPSAILQEAGVFKELPGTSDVVLVLKPGDVGVLKMLYAVPADTTVSWETSNQYVISMLDDSELVQNPMQNKTGKFTAIGTGKVTIKVNYADMNGDLKSSTIRAFVAPEVKVENGGVVQDKISVKKGDSISLGAIMQPFNEVINEKVNWILTKNDGTTYLESSSTGTKKYLSSSSLSGVLGVIGPAGEYVLHVYTAGMYNGIDVSAMNASVQESLRTPIVLKIIPNPTDVLSPISLQAGDTYNVAEIFNMTVDDFNTYFAADPAGSCVDGVYTAKEPGSYTLKIAFKENMKGAFSNLYGNDVTLKDEYKIEFNVYRGFTLDRAEALIYKGDSLRLSTVYGGNKGVITWKSSDSSKVAVNGSSTSALITGVESTGAKPVIITASMKLEDGRTLTATCEVKVSTTATKIKLNKTSVTFGVGDTVTITASYEPSTTTSVNLRWLIADDTIAEVTQNSDKSVVVTAKKAGTTILTAVNADNYIAAYCTITVSSLIEKLTLNHTMVTMTMSQEVLKLRATYTPTTATETELKWTSGNSAVATVDETGLVTFKGPGTTIITVQPAVNPTGKVMDQCNLTVIASPTMFSLDQAAITLETGETKTLKPVLTAANSTTTLTWKSINPAVATVSNSGVVTGVSAGQAYIVVTTKEGLVANCQVTVTQKANGITLSNYNIKVGVGEKTTVIATPVPATSSETKFTWSSRDNKIATVSDGVVTGVSGGSTIITVKTKTGDSAILYVNVYDKATGMTLNYSNKELAKGATFKLKPVFTPQNVSNTKVTWKSLNPTIASVSTSGVVAGLKGGAAVITAVSDDGGYLSTCLVTVVQPVTSIKLNYSSYKLGIGKSIALKATVTSNSASNAKVKWSTSNSRIATVSSTGIVKGKKLGSCTITAKATDGSGKKVSSKIRVVRSVSSISLNKSVLTVVASKTATLKATVRPSNATYKTVTWTTSNSSVAVVDSKGHVTGLAVGSCTVKATAKDSSKKAAICYVNVINPIPASSIILSARDLVMIKGQSQMLSYTVTPSNHTDKISFSSDNKSVATITGTGRIYARRTGAATISVTSSSGKQATVSVTVIGLNKTLLSLEQYDTETLTVDGAGSGVTWYSDNPSVATVSGGKVVARKAGTTTVRARVNGVILSCTVRVKGIS